MTEEATQKGVFMDVEAIRRYLPHAYPMLLMDRVLEYHSGESIVALKNVTANEPQLPGHYPHRFIYPGVLICESMCQAGALLGLLTLEDRGRLRRDADGMPAGSTLLTQIESFRIKRPVVPGDQLILKAKLNRFGDRRGLVFGHIGFSSEVDGKIVAFGSYRAVLEPGAPE